MPQRGGSGIDLSGKVAVVTGSGRGIGASIATTFGSAGADVTIVDLDQETGQSTASKIREMGRKALFVEADIGSSRDVDRLFNVVHSSFGRVDILVNNAGIWFRRPFLEISDSEWDRVLATNLRGTFMCTQRAARIMMANRSGCIINIASQAGLTYSRGQGAHYAASKAAIIQLTRVLAFELGPFGIRINAIAPGGTEKGESASTGEVLKQPAPAGIPDARGQTGRSGSLELTPLGRRGRPDDIAQAGLFFASDMAAFVTGQTLLVNGGSIAYL